MKLFHKLLFFTFFLSFISFNCTGKKEDTTHRVIIGLQSDIESLNPLFAFDINESYITDLLYLSLVHHNWNSDTGEIETSPMLAKSWEWNSDSTTITIKLRDDVKWSDGVSVTSEDVLYTFDLSSDPVLDSRFFATFNNFYVNKDKHIDLTKTFEILSPYEFKIHFLPKSTPSLFNIDIPILPKHVFEKIVRKDMQNSGANANPVTDGPFVLTKWEQNQVVRLKANTDSFLYEPGGIDEIIFKIIPDYSSRLLQIQNGEIDLVTDLRPDDINTIRSKSNLSVVPIKGREYDYLGWNNLDPNVYQKNKKIVPNKFFGSSKVRKALTYAINRTEVIENFLLDYGEMAIGPVAPIFKSIFDNSVVPYEFNPDKARKMLAEEGWKPSPKDGILTKNGLRFSFNLVMGAGNPRREFAASIFKNNLRAVGIDVSVEKMEMGSFIQKLFSKQFDAWIAGWSVPIPIDLAPYWRSDLGTAMFNLSSYNNKTVDQLLNKLETNIPKHEKIQVYKNILGQLHDDEPVSFLYWVDKIVVYNTRIKDININPLGPMNEVWKWKIR